MDVPEAWDSVDGSLWLDDDGTVLGAQLSAEPSGDEAKPFVSFLATPISEAVDVGEVLDAFAEDYGTTCATTEERSDYEDGLYTGQYDYYTGCGDADEVIFVVAAMPEEQDFLVLVLVQALTEADLSAADRIFDTFKVIGELPGTE
jgi:serine protease Do